jgi:transcription elongation factor B subunit 1
VKLPNISGILLEKVCEYLYFNLKYKNKTGVPQFEIPPELALEMLVVADFLDSKYNL